MAIGALLGLTGAGGGILAVPALMFGLHLGLAEAAPVALIAVGSAAALGAMQGLRNGLVRYKAAILMAIAGGLTAPFGLLLARQLPAASLSLGFAAVMLIVAARMARQTMRRSTPQPIQPIRPAQPIQSTRPTPSMSSMSPIKPSLGASSEVPGGSPPPNDPQPDSHDKPCRLSPTTGRFIWTRRAAVTLGSIGAVSGVCTGLLGVGGGFIIVPALTRFSDARIHSIVSTSLMVIALVSAVTVTSAAAHGLALTATEWAFVGAAIAGMALGRTFASRVPQAALQRVFASVCVVVAGVLVWRAVG
nr:sulfite exporter TauE/SafE family protein [Bordetella sp. LUAb4]